MNQFISGPCGLTQFSGESGLKIKRTSLSIVSKAAERSSKTKTALGPESVHSNIIEHLQESYVHTCRYSLLALPYQSIECVCAPVM